jgi:hypothetical protein
MISARGMLVLTACGAVFLCLPASVGAHSWYPSDCCSDRDCAPHDSADIEEKPEGFTIKSTGEFVERSKAKVAPDDQFHVCRYQTSQIIICFFQPNRGV